MKFHNDLRQYINIALLTLLVTLVTTACNAAAPAPKTAPSAVRIGTTKWVGLAPLYIARDKGFFAKEGVKVELINYENYDNGVADFASKKLDGYTYVLSDNIAQAAAQIPLKAIWVFDASNGGDVLVVNSSIKSAADLKGKRIGLSRGTFGHVFTLQVLAQLGIERSDVTIVNINGESVPQAIIDGKIDAGHTWEPYLAQAIEFGAHPLIDSSKTPGLIPEMLTFQNSTLLNRPEELRAILRAIRDGNEYWAAHPDEGNQIVAKEIGITPADIPAYLQGDHLYSISEVQAALDPNSPQSLYKTAAVISDFFIKEKVIDQAPDPALLFDTSFAQSLFQNKQ